MHRDTVDRITLRPQTHRKFPARMTWGDASATLSFGANPVASEAADAVG